MAQPHTIKIGNYTLPLSAEGLDIAELEGYSVHLKPILFDFEYRKIWFRCSCDASNAATAQITLSACLGAVPFTAESPYARATAIAIAHTGHRQLKGALNIADGYIAFSQQKTIESPVTSVVLVSAIVVALTTLNPYITFLGEIVRPLSKKNLPAAHPKV